MLFFPIIFVLFGTCLAEELESCSKMDVDLCGQQLHTLILDTKVFPETEEELHSLCLTLNSGYDCLTDYMNRCETAIPQKMSSSLLDSTKKAIDAFCSINGGSMFGMRLLPHGMCLKNNLPSDVPCTRQFIERLEVTTVIEPSSLRAEAACCAYAAFDTCNYNQTESYCGPEPAQIMRFVIQDFGTALLDTCLPYISQPVNCNLDIFEEVPSFSGTVSHSVLPSLLNLAPTFISDVDDISK